MRARNDGHNNKVDRLTRVNALLKRELADLIERGELCPSGMLLSVTEVNTSVDLRNATVEISIFGGEAKAREAAFRELEIRRVELQERIARSLKFKHTPVLNFHLDRRMERGDRVLEILNAAEQKEDGRDGDR